MKEDTEIILKYILRTVILTVLISVFMMLFIIMCSAKQSNTGMFIGAETIENYTTISSVNKALRDDDYTFRKRIPYTDQRYRGYMTELSGYYLGYPVFVETYSGTYLPAEKDYRVAMINIESITKYDVWTEILKDYNYILNIYIDKYGEPDIHYSSFDNTNGIYVDEIRSLLAGSTDYYAIWEITSDRYRSRIRIYMSSECRICITIENINESTVR